MRGEGNHTKIKRGRYTQVSSRFGDMLVNEHDKYIGRSLLTYGEFSYYEYALLEQICRKDYVLVEVGANIGAHTVALAKHIGSEGKIYAFEAQPEIFKVLCANVINNGLQNVHCLPIAIGSEIGEISYPFINYDCEENFGAISLDLADKIASDERTPVQIKPLDKVINPKRLDVMKIDVEGMEIDVLLGAETIIQQFLPLIYLENDRLEKSASLINILWEFGYDLWWHSPPLFNPENYFNIEDNIFRKIVSYNMLAIPVGKNINVRNLRKVQTADEHPMLLNGAT